MDLTAVTLAVIVLTLLTVSLTRLGKVHTRADYLIAGRSLPAFVLVFTLLSSWIGSGSLLGGAENAYRHGFAALWQPAGGWAGLALIYFIAPRARRFAQYTIPDLLETRYNQTARVLGVIAILFTYTAITSYQFIGGGDILHLIFPASITAIHGRYLIAAFVILFTAIAGMSSVAYMDVAIGLLATFTLCAALPVLLHSFGGWLAVRAALPASHFHIFGDLHPFNSYFGANLLPDGTHERISSALEIFLPTCLLMLGNQSMYQKFFSAKSEKDACRAVAGWIVGTVILETVIVALAVAGSAIFPTGDVHDHPREILAYTGLHAFTGSRPLMLLGALLVGAIFAKIVSTANNYLFSPAANLVNDLFVRYLKPRASNKEVLLVSRAHGRPARSLGALPGPAHRVRPQEVPLRLHHLLRRAHARHPRRLLLASRHCLRRRRLHLYRDLRHRLLGHGLHPYPSPRRPRRTRRHLPRAPRQPPLPHHRQPAHPAPHGIPPPRLRRELMRGPCIFVVDLLEQRSKCQI